MTDANDTSPRAGYIACFYYYYNRPILFARRASPANTIAVISRYLIPRNYLIICRVELDDVYRRFLFIIVASKYTRARARRRRIIALRKMPARPLNVSSRSSSFVKSGRGLGPIRGTERAWKR